MGRDQHLRADSNQHGEEDGAHQGCGNVHSHHFEIVHADCVQIAGMHLVVKREAEALDLLVAREPQLVRDMMSGCFGKLVLRHREKAAQHADAKQQKSRNRECLLCRRSGNTAADDCLGLVDRTAEELRDEQLESCSDERRADGEDYVPRVPRIHARNAQQRAQAAAQPAAFTCTSEFRSFVAPPIASLLKSILPDDFFELGIK